MLHRLDYLFSGIVSGVGGVLTYIYGDVNTLMICLFGFISFDYISGVIVACYEKKLSSSVGFKGLLKKMWILIMLGVACLLDRALNVNGICKSMVCCFYIANEGISIIENGGKLGLPIPKKIIDMLLAVKRKAEESEVDKNGSTD